jgi:plasmid maintenance system antidote protein VapI
MQENEIHIGNLIRNHLKEDGRSASWLASKIHCKRDNIYKIFNKPSIDTAQLLRISFVMKINYFSYLSEYYQNTIHKMDNDDLKKDS